jgi:DNA-binding beta-propeller fold protein YncE
MHLPGYIATPFVNMPNTRNSPSDIEIDGLGNLYIPTLPDGIQRVTSSGAISLWTTAPASDLALLPSGEAVGAGRASCNCLLAIFSDGSYLPFLEGYEWTWVSVDLSTGLVHGSIFAGDDQGLYEIDLIAGTISVLVNGGPGPRGAGVYYGMDLGADGKLYTLGNDGAGTYGLYRLDGSEFVQVAELPRPGASLTGDPSGIFYTASAESGEVWIIEPTSGNVSLLASGLTWPGGVAFDPMTSKLYVAEQLGDRTVYAFTQVTPVAPTSWGKLKARYRQP